MEWSPTRREFLGTVGLGHLSRTNETGGTSESISASTATVEWTVDTSGEAAFLRQAETDPVLYAGTKTHVYCLSTDGT